MDTLHLYCVVGDGKELPCPPDGVNGGRVSAIRHRDLAAFVSPAPVRAYRGAKREEVLRYLVAHQAVIEGVMEHHTVVPVRFGTTAREEAEVRRILDTGHLLLRGMLEAMEGTIELDLVAQWHDLSAVIRQIEDPEIRAQSASVAGRPPQETFEARVRIGQLVRVWLDRLREERAAEIVAALEPLAGDLCPHALLDDRMILNMAFLVRKAMEAEVGETLERLNASYRDSIDFRCVGPLPPYSFATVEIRRFEVEEIDRARRLLGLGEWATLPDVKEAYRRLAQRCHPDKGGREVAGPFEEATAAYRLLEGYLQVSSSFRASDVGEAVTVRLLPGSPGAKVA